MSHQVAASARQKLSIVKVLPRSHDRVAPRPIPPWVEWLSCLTGLLGSGLLALKGDYAGWGFVAYLVSNVGWTVYGTATRTWSMVLMQLGFTATSLIGIKNYLFP